MKWTTIQKRKSVAMIAVFSACVFLGCEDFVSIDLPKTKLTAQSVFDNDATATAAALSMYEIMARAGSFSASGSPSSITCLAGIYADELTNYSNTNLLFAENGLVASNSSVLSVWASAYTTIFSANAVIEGLSTGKVNPKLKDQLEGEARFVRAFCYFYLMQLFGNVPLVMTTDYRINAVKKRTPVPDVYDFVIHELQTAKQLLPESYVSEERVRPNAWAARALLARVFLYQGNWLKAESMATEVINHKELFSLVNDLSKVFVKESREAIWQLCTTSPTSLNTYEGYYFILLSAPQTTTMSDDLVYAFDENDLRKIIWVGSYSSGSSTWYFPHKYKLKNGTTPPQEHSIVLRLAEMYLIRSEARMHQGKLTGQNGAASDLDSIRVRAGLGLTTADSEEKMLMAIEAERRMELFGEWGHRWFDLKRTNRATAVLSPLKPGWNENDILFPIPESEILANGNLKPQNPGY
jgi:starch-binding outer membrane protein, SusD/RagB family